MKKKSRLYKNLYIFSCVLGIIILYLLCLIPPTNYYRDQTTEYTSKKLDITASTNEEDYLKETSLSLVMVGDCLIHGAVYADAKTRNGYDFRPMFENVKEVIQEYDLAFYNQESILGGTELGLSTYPRFNSPYEVGDAFREMGFNLVSLANNHTLDRGEKAIINFKNYWNNYEDILTSGSYKSQKEKDEIKIKETNGITYALLSYTDTTNGLKTPTGKEYLVNRYDEEQIKQDIETIRDKVDLLLVSMHFGVEYTHNPTIRQREIATFLKDQGVDIVIGHHPHVIQPIEWIGDTLVIYSLENFISAQRGVEKLTGLMASVEIKKVTKFGKTTTSIEKVEAELIYTDSTITSYGRSNFKLYRYQDLTNDILPNYKEYQQKFLNIVTKSNTNIETR